MGGWMIRKYNGMYVCKCYNEFIVLYVNKNRCSKELKDCVCSIIRYSWFVGNIFKIIKIIIVELFRRKWYNNSI